MFNHNYDRSFIAYVACTTPGYEGYLDFAKLADKGGEAGRVADDWMIVSSFKHREPHRIWFRCLFDETIGRPYYDIQSWSRRSGRDFQSSNRHLACSHNGYAGLYAQRPDDESLWKVMTLQDGKYSSMTSIAEVGQHIDMRIRTRSNLTLQAVNRQEVCDHWFAYVATGGGQALDLRLEILDVGEELMDDQ